MSFLTSLEFFGSMASILGAFMMSKSTSTDTRPLYYAFIFYIIGNFFMIYFFLFKGLVPILLQMLFFMFTAVNGLVRMTSNLRRDLSIFVMVSIMYIFVLVLSIVYLPIKDITYSFGVIEMIASVLAISGSYLVASHNHKVRLYAFILFIVADVLLVYVSIIHAMYFFLAQSLFFIYTSVMAFYRTNGSLNVFNIKNN